MHSRCIHISNVTKSCRNYTIISHIDCPVSNFIKEYGEKGHNSFLCFNNSSIT